MKDLLDIYNTIIELDNETSLRIHLGFRVQNISEKVKLLCDKGWWHCYVLSSKQFSNQDVCLRITPWETWDEWNLSVVHSRSCAYSILNNVYALPIIRLEHIEQHKDVFEEFQEEFQEFEELIRPVYQILSIEQELSFIRDYLADKDNVPDGSDHEERYLNLLFRYDTSDVHRLFRKKLSEMIKEPDVIPYDGIDQHLGAWDQRFRNILARRAIDHSNAIALAKLAPMLWNAFVLPHGFDTAGSKLSQYPDTSSPPEIFLTDIARLLTADYYEFPPEITEHPLYKAATALNERGSGYTGVEHAEAAAVLDEHYADPIGSWNALVSAAFWAGRNNAGEDMQLALWDQAIWLCEKEDWVDAHSALKHQRQLYDGTK